MNAPLSTHPTPPYKHTPLFPLGKDTTPYRKIARRREGRAHPGRGRVGGAARGVPRARRSRLHRHQSSAAPGASREPQAHRRGPGGVGQRQVRRLRLSQERQYRGGRRAADVPGHRHRDHHGQEGPAHLDRRRRRGGARRGRARRLSEAQSALFAARADFHVRGEEHAHNMPAQVEIYAEGHDLLMATRTPPTSSCSSPRAAARPTSRFCSRRRRRS